VSPGTLEKDAPMNERAFHMDTPPESKLDLHREAYQDEDIERSAESWQIEKPYDSKQTFPNK